MASIRSLARRGAPALVVFAALAGCATPPPPKQAKTTVILMPDEEGNVGAVSVTNQTGSVNVDQAYAATTVVGSAKPSASNAVGNESVEKTYAGLLQAQPPKPKSFTLYFLVDRAVLTKESEALIPAVLDAVRERKPTEISIFGHTDATGTESHNVKLSGERANTIATLLRRKDPSLDHIEVQYFGSKMPLVESGTKAQPKNRRAEIMIL